MRSHPIKRNCISCGQSFQTLRCRQRFCGYSCSGRQNALLAGATPPEQRFWAKVDKSGDCWVWTACLTSVGYGKFGVSRGRIVVAHRYAYELAYGPIPGGRLVCHRCDNRLCVRPDHLFLGSHKDNTHDAIAKGRLARGERQGSAKLTASTVTEIFLLRGREYQYVTAERFSVTQSSVNRIQTGKTWRHVTGQLTLAGPSTSETRPRICPPGQTNTDS